ncbi:contractile injection system protein, VgrG/Pvc8 family [Enterobacter hormaechei]
MPTASLTRFDVRLPYREPSGLFDGAAESVWDVRTWHRIVTGTVATRDYNYRTATTPMDATVSVRSNAVTTGEHYRYKCAPPGGRSSRRRI